MPEAAQYFSVEQLPNGRRAEIRALRPDDQPEFLAAIDRASSQSLYRRFLSFRRGLAPQEIAFFLNVDFVKHVALVAVMDEAGRQAIVGGARYIVLQPGEAEIAFAVIDAYQRQGIGAALMRHLTALARQSGIKTLVADVLPENIAMLKVFEKSGLDVTTERGSVVHLTFRLA